MHQLALGTHKLNMADMASKGWAPRGSRNGAAKLTERDVLAIRADSRPQRAIASRFGISQAQVWSIKTGQSWAHIGETV